MQKRMSYALYKSSYSQFVAHNYNCKSKTIIVDLPDIKRHSWPKEWEKVQTGIYRTPNGCVVKSYGTGISRSYSITGPYHFDPFNPYKMPDLCFISAGIDAFDKMLATVAKF